MKINNILSMSGGKDSCSTALLAVAQEVDFEMVSADTGHEHPETYEYLDYLESWFGKPIRRVKADFSEQIARKRRKLIAGELPGWTDAARDRALQVLYPTGIPFLDLCMWKGRFPSSQARFCTQFLKTEPIIEQVFLPLLDANEIIWSWQGVRRDESHARRYAKEFEEVGGGLFNYRPLVRWNADRVFEAHRYMGLKPNPLYKQGMGRVGCMPCVNSNKAELQAIALRFPDEVARVREWERLVSEASRRQSSTFFTATNDALHTSTDLVDYKTHGIDRMIEWSGTARGGRQFDLIAASADPESCKSAYGLCE
ncbi:phosphoadenosine phosphosulfate reductase family protein [Neptunomonas japonica]|uniref:Phosphoadenosine phosphosulfate reductase n=1 Tax=Neptunomonas japonica JAMM 1380 TaxID=1441457 RepID=A0A7R6SVA6_9GAMM|nr:phosphoadenosine phosphosulfate reductase family protein [Neptunomonas japonica]BBB29339.1 phosphoadenosine phosphosulfate reductase [Neptunomonas japonica JAMM 1380]